MKTKTNNFNRPKVGMTMEVHGVPGTIVKVHPAGTVDVLTVKGKTFRVTGLPFV